MFLISILFTVRSASWFSNSKSSEYQADKDWHQQIHSATNEELQIISLGANKLDQYINKDCFKDAALKLSKKCLVELLYEEKIRFAIELTLCELKTASFDPPLECLQLDQPRCVNALSRIPQWWTSFSGYVKETVIMCLSVRAVIEKEELTDMYRNITYLQLYNYHVLQRHTAEFTKLKEMTDNYMTNIQSIFTELSQQTLDLQPQVSNTKSVLNLIEDVMISLSKQVISTKQELLDLQLMASNSMKSSRQMTDKMEEIQTYHTDLHKTTQNTSLVLLSNLKDAGSFLDLQLSQFQKLFSKTTDLISSLDVVPVISSHLLNSLEKSNQLQIIVNLLNKDISVMQETYEDTAHKNQLSLQQYHLQNVKIMTDTKLNLVQFKNVLSNMFTTVEEILVKYNNISSSITKYTNFDNANWQYLMLLSQFVGFNNLVIVGTISLVWKPRWILGLCIFAYLGINAVNLINWVAVVVFLILGFILRIVQMKWSLRLKRSIILPRDKSSLKYKIQSRYRREF